MGKGLREDPSRSLGQITVLNRVTYVTHAKLEPEEARGGWNSNYELPLPAAVQQVVVEYP